MAVAQHQANADAGMKEMRKIEAELRDLQKEDARLVSEIEMLNKGIRRQEQLISDITGDPVVHRAPVSFSAAFPSLPALGQRAPSPTYSSSDSASPEKKKKSSCALM